MPPEEGNAMPTADLHGSTIQIETGKGEKTTFELVRVGTLKEFETVKGALATSRAAEQSLDGLNEDLKGKVAHANELLEAAEAAYKEACDRHAATIDSKTQIQSVLAAARAELENLMTVKASLEEATTALEVKDKELTEAREANYLVNEHWREEKVISAQLRKERDASNSVLAELKAELLAEGDRFKTILDVMAEKISGE